MARKDRRPQESAEVHGSARDGHGAKSAAVREQAILALLSEKSIGEAAARCNVNERTIRRWLAEPEFQAEYQKARRAVFDVGISRVQALTGKAVDTLEALLTAKTPPAVQLGAARTIAELGIHERDAETIVSKLEEIEAAMRRRDGR
jgi:hypothetical protein